MFQIYNAILEVNIDDIIEKSFGENHYAERTKKFVRLCLQPIESRPFLYNTEKVSSGSLMEQEFYQYYADQSRFRPEYVKEFIIQLENQWNLKIIK